MLGSLGWIPFKALGINVTFSDMRAWTALESRKSRARGRGLISYCGETYEFWASRELPADAVIKTGSFNQDAMGHWYVNITFESFSLEFRGGETPVGIDPGVITMATLSTGITFEGPKLRERYLSQVRHLERTRLHARRQQAKNQTFGPLPKKKRMTRLHARIAHARADYLHKASTKVVEAHKDIFIGNVPCRLMNRSRNMAGVSLDNGLGAFKTQVSYKATQIYWNWGGWRD